MWAKARSLARHLGPAFDNLRIVSGDEALTNTQEAPGSTQDETEPVDQSAQVTAERDQLRAELADAQDRLLRRQAEFENYRRRTERDRSEFFEYAGMEFVRELLPVLDDFERARKTECSDANYQKGIELIFQRLVDSLKK